MTPQEGRHAFFRHRLQNRRDTCLAEIFLGEDIASDLRPVCRNFHLIETKHDRAIRIADLARRGTEGNPLISRLSCHCEATLDTHLVLGLLSLLKGLIIIVRRGPGRQASTTLHTPSTS